MSSCDDIIKHQHQKYQINTISPQGFGLFLELRQLGAVLQRGRVAETSRKEYLRFFNKSFLEGYLGLQNIKRVYLTPIDAHRGGRGEGGVRSEKLSH